MRTFALVLAALLASPAAAQTVQQAGPWSQRHAPAYTASQGGRSTPYVQDSGPAGGGTLSNAPGISEGLYVVPSLNSQSTGPFANSGTGPFHTNWCDYDNNPVTAHYHYLCLSPDAAGGGLIAFGAVGAPQIPLYFNINGTTTTIGGSISSLTVGSTTIGPNTVPNGDLLYNNAGVLGAISFAFPIPVSEGGTGGTTFITGAPLLGNGGSPIGQGTVQVLYGGTGATSFTAGLPVLGGSPLTQGTISGNTTAFLTADGVLVNGHCPQIDSSGGLVDSGNACGGGGGGGSGTVSAGTTGQLSYYATSGTTVSGATTGAGVLTALSNPVNAAGGLATFSGAGNSIASYGASNSSLTGTCTTTASSMTISCSNVADFAIGQGYRQNKAGATNTVGQVTGVTITPCGTPGPSGNLCAPGSVHESYAVAAIDGRGGVSTASTTVSTTTGPTLGPNGYNKIAWTAVSGAAGYVVYGRASGTLAVIGFVIGGTQFFDFGSAANPVLPADDWLPTAPLVSNQNDWLLTTITNVSGSTITTAAAAGQAVTGTVFHDNSHALTAALASGSAGVVVPCGTYLIVGFNYTVASGQTLSGQSCGTLKESTINLQAVFLSVAGGSQIVDLTINGEEAGNDTNTNAPNVTTTISCGGGCDSMVISRVVLDRFPEFGLYIGNGSNISVNNNVFYKNTPLPTQNACMDISLITFSSISLNQCLGASIQIASAQDMMINNNVIAGWAYSGGIGLGGDNATYENTISGNNISVSFTGPDVNNTYHDCMETYSAWTVITGNSVADCAGTGILVDGFGDAVTGNSATNNGQANRGGGNQAGIFVQAIGGSINQRGENSTISGNTVANTGGQPQLYGIWATGGQTFCEQGNQGENLTTNVVLNGSTNSCF